MNKPIPPPDMWDRLADAEAAAGISPFETLTDGWFTAAEYAVQRKVSARTARERLSKLIASEALDSKMAVIKQGRTTKEVRIYRIKD